MLQSPFMHSKCFRSFTKAPPSRLTLICKMSSASEGRTKSPDSLLELCPWTPLEDFRLPDCLTCSPLQNPKYATDCMQFITRTNRYSVGCNKNANSPSLLFIDAIRIRQVNRPSLLTLESSMLNLYQGTVTENSGKD